MSTLRRDVKVAAVSRPFDSAPEIVEEARPNRVIISPRPLSVVTGFILLYSDVHNYCKFILWLKSVVNGLGGGTKGAVPPNRTTTINVKYQKRCVSQPGSIISS